TRSGSTSPGGKGPGKPPRAGPRTLAARPSAGWRMPPRRDAPARSAHGPGLRPGWGPSAPRPGASDRRWFSSAPPPGRRADRAGDPGPSTPAPGRRRARGQRAAPLATPPATAGPATAGASAASAANRPGQGRPAEEFGVLAQLLFDAQELVVLGQPVAAGQGAGLDLPAVDGHGQVG